jgi:WD40 repeat protein
MNGHTSIVRGIAYSVDGKYLATVSNDETGQSVGRGERRGSTDPAGSLGLCSRSCLQPRRPSPLDGE